ncbi:SDR family NAD(P)-dependent oxidoreductase [Mycetocola spongiae]|uniref:SDR family NAD(P)-dependent oxidoreductase n=1 Tax=Mycetocola spongiae TaxID=2859226 RepID=UPI001CF5D99A|nr:SDR family oxidoreductase [Mycetocola spongiae]UCR88912.1 SDR family oxidoreductase [Mycetocola spongiae]
MSILITGASSGIGEQFARAYAARGHGLILVARSEKKLERLAAELRAAHGIRVEVIALDLARPGSAEALVETTRRMGLEINTLVNNAGFATHGDIVDADPVRMVEQIQLNCSTLADLTARFLPAMRERGRGTIVNIASTAAFQPLPHMAVYGAAKAFVLSFTEALWAENRRHGIRILAVCPGATDTAFFETAGEAAASGTKRSPRLLVERTLRELEGGKPSFVDGAANALIARCVTRLLPRRVILGIAERSVRAA